MGAHDEALQLDALLGSGVALLLVLTTAVLPSSPSLVHAILGFLVGLVLPGYFLVGIVFPRGSDLTGVERWGLILVMNVVVIIVLSLLISLIHSQVSVIRLDALTVSSTLSLVTVILAAALVWRRTQLVPSQAYRFALPHGWGPWLVFALAVVLACTTWLAVRSNLSNHAVSFSITSRGGLLSGYPFELVVGSKEVLVLHVDNPTSSPVAFRMVIGDNHGLSRRQIARVGPHGRWSQPLVLPSNGPPRSEAVHFDLTQGAQVVRTLWIRYRIVP